MTVGPQTNRLDAMPAARRSPMLLFVGLLVVYASFDHVRDWNTASRFMLTYAVVQEHTFEITDFVAANGRLLTNPQTRDLAMPRPGRFFCDKAPGHSLLGTAPYAAALQFGLSNPHPLRASVMKRWPADYWITLGTSGVLTAAAAVLVMLLCTQLGCSPRMAMGAALAFGLATIALPYATLFYGHASAGFFTLLSAWLLERWPGSGKASFCAGVSAGAAVVCEYTLAVFPCAVVVAGLVAWIRGNAAQRVRLLPFLAGGVPMAILLGSYHTFVTGAPWLVPYTAEVETVFSYHREGIGIPIGRFDWNVARELLIGWRRGLLWYAPVVFGAIPGVVVLLARGRTRLAILATMTFAGLFAINAGYPTWHGGGSTGPRFLLPAMPLAMVACGAWLAWRPDRWALGCLQWIGICIWGIAAILSSAWLIACTATGARIPEMAMNPWRQFVEPVFVRREQSPNLGDYLARELGLVGTTGFPGVVLLGLFVAAIAGGLLLQLRRVRANS